MTSIIATRQRISRRVVRTPQVAAGLRELHPLAQKVFNLAKKITGMDPAQFRIDPYGMIMDHDQYGKTTQMGWQIGHIIPKNRGGSDAIRNLQAMNSHINMSKQDSLQMRSRHNQ